jgi:hypothetical protein
LDEFDSRDTTDNGSLHWRQLGQTCDRARPAARERGGSIVEVNIESLQVTAKSNRRRAVPIRRISRKSPGATPLEVRRRTGTEHKDSIIVDKLAGGIIISTAEPRV